MGPFGLPVGSLGHPLGPLWVPLGHLGYPLGPLWLSVGPLGIILQDFRVILGPCRYRKGPEGGEKMFFREFSSIFGDIQ